MSELIQQLDDMSSRDPLFFDGVTKLIDHMDDLSNEEKGKAFLLMERLIKGDEEIERENTR